MFQTSLKQKKSTQLFRLTVIKSNKLVKLFARWLWTKKRWGDVALPAATASVYGYILINKQFNGELKQKRNCDVIAKFGRVVCFYYWHWEFIHKTLTLWKVFVCSWNVGSDGEWWQVRRFAWWEDGMLIKTQLIEGSVCSRVGAAVATYIKR